MVYMVNGQCNCPDRVTWCNHRIGRALARKAAQSLENENGAGDEVDTPAPASNSTIIKRAPCDSVIVIPCSQRPQGIRRVQANAKAI